MRTDLCCLLRSGLLEPGQPAGKPEWMPVLAYVADLRRRCVHPAEPPLPHEWVNIGPGYCYGPAFGHFDLVHMLFDFVADDPDLARRQMLNQVSIQRADGTIPFVWMGENPARTWLPAGTPMTDRLKNAGTFPPLWPAGVEACLEMEANAELLAKALTQSLLNPDRFNTPHPMHAMARVWAFARTTFGEHE